MKHVATTQALLFVAMLSVVLAGDGVRTLDFDLTIANMHRLNEQEPLQPLLSGGTHGLHPAGALRPVAMGNLSWCGLVHGVPMQFSRPPHELEQDLHILIEWLVRDRGPVWLRDLEEDPHWFPASERNTLTAKYRRYNFLREALASESTQVAATARSLRSFLRHEWAAFTDGFPEVVSMMHDAVERQAWEQRMKPVDDLRQVPAPTFHPTRQPSRMRNSALRYVSHHQQPISLPPCAQHPSGPFLVGLHVQSWMNSHGRALNQGEGTSLLQWAQNQSLHMHAHTFSWHAYLLLDAGGSNTVSKISNATIAPRRIAMTATTTTTQKSRQHLDHTP